MYTGRHGSTLQESPSWPTQSGPYVVLIDASSILEAEMLTSWIREASTGVLDSIDVFRVPASRRQRRYASVDPSIGERLAAEDDPLCLPVRIVWLAKERDGVRRVHPSDLLKPGDPRDPNFLLQHVILARHRERCRVVLGEPARCSDLKKRWSAPTGRGAADGTAFEEFVALQAWLALERSERHLRGLRYKVPKFLREDLFWSRPFQAGIQRLARQEGSSEQRLRKRSGRYLKEMAAQHSPYVIDIVNGITTFMIEAAHHGVDYSREDLQAIYKLGETDPLVFLPSHKSNFDHLVLQHLLYENELPLNHTAGGVNMNFFPIGPLLRRSGIFFIRRHFKENEPYKFVLRQYLDYLLEKRFALEWYIEGGRSRSGKLREPMMGLLAYVVDSYQRGITSDVVLIPVSIAYDQISDMSSYAAEQRGGQKQKESLRWLLFFIAGLKRRNGRIHVRFGEPLALSDHVGRNEDLTTPEGRLAVPRIAFAINARINAVTPITAISLVTLALLSEEKHGLTVSETSERIAPFMKFVTERNIPTTDDLPFTSHVEIEVALDALVASNVVHRSDGLTDRIYAIERGKRLAAAYYRNTIIHFFVNAGITELAFGLCTVRESPVVRSAIVERALEIRDLLKFEFFFSPSDQYADEIREEVGHYTINDVADEDVVEFSQGTFPAKSPIVLRPFFTSYFVIASVLALEGSRPLTEDELTDKALLTGEQLAAHGDIAAQEAVSTTLLATGIKLAASRGLLNASAQDRETFRSELREILDTLNTINEWEPA